jgi:thioredoxin 1
VTSFKFYSTSWCGNCKIMKPIMKELAPDTEFILLDDVDEESLILLNIQSVPVIVKYVDGGEVGRLMGGQSKASMTKFVKGK